MAKGKTKRHASALKAKRQGEARRLQNFQVRNSVRTLTNRTLKYIKEKNLEAAKEGFKIAQAAWHKAAKNGIFHKSVANRKISRLASLLVPLTKG